jgi:hypothetical protein
MTSYWHHIALNDNDMSDVLNALTLWEEQLKQKYGEDNFRLVQAHELRLKFENAKTSLRSSNNFSSNTLPPFPSLDEIEDKSS